MAMVKYSIRNQATLSYEELILKAGLIGFLAGDGSIQQDEYHAGCLIICPGQCLESAEWCMAAVNRIYSNGENICSIDARYNKEGEFEQWIVRISRQAVVDDIKKCCPGWHVNGTVRTTWNIPEWVWKDHVFLRAFIRCYAEADGCISYKPKKRSRHLSLDSTNGSSLLQVKTALESLGFQPGYSVTLKVGCKDAHKVEMTHQDDLVKFYNEIGFLSKIKKDKLEAIVKGYKRNCRRKDVPEEVVERIRSLFEVKTVNEIVEALNGASEKKTWTYNRVRHIINKYKLHK